MYQLKTIGVLTSGGDAPGMNAALRAVTRAAIFNGISVKAICRGYRGLINNEIIDFKTQNVSNIIQHGGTIIKTARCQEFQTPEGRKLAYDTLKSHNIDALVVLGGDGTFTGAKVFAQEYNFPIIGVPCTIDNDLYGTDFTIGYDTAVNTCLAAIDKIRDTADAHERVFFIEVMGRDTGYIAVRSAIAGGAEMAIIPEENHNIPAIIDRLKNGISNSKASHIIIVAEGDQPGRAAIISNEVKKEIPSLDSKVTILGHVQRGGAPTAADRVLASRLGLAAVEGLLAGKANVMAGIIDHEVVYTPFIDTITKRKPIRNDLVEIVPKLNGRNYNK